MNIVCPMAGAGSRFKISGWNKPKPLYEVGGCPMIKRVVENLLKQIGYDKVDSFVAIAREDQYDEIKSVFFNDLRWHGITPKLIPVSGVTRGAVETVMAAELVLDKNDSLLTMNCDQLIWGDFSPLFDASNNALGITGIIQTIQRNLPSYSYVKIDTHGDVKRVVEKEVISNDATTGLYFWTKGYDFFTYAKKMISENITSRGEFYIAPMYQLMINEGHRITTFPAKEMCALGTPDEIRNFERLMYDNFTHK